jgi:hypothetical protein
LVYGIQKGDSAQPCAFYLRGIDIGDGRRFSLCDTGFEETIGGSRNRGFGR